MSRIEAAGLACDGSCSEVFMVVSGVVVKARLLQVKRRACRVREWDLSAAINIIKIVIITEGQCQPLQPKYSYSP